MYKRVIQFVVPVISMLLLWESASYSGLVNAALFPAPSKVFRALWLMVADGTLVLDTVISLRRLLAGLVIGVIAGVFVGMTTGRNRIMATILSPIIQLVRPLPPVAVIPLIIVWFGIDDGAKIFSIALAIFFPIWINTHIGCENIAQAYIWNARLLTSSSLKIFTKVIFPAALPFIVAGIRNAISLAFIMVFVSELAGASSGLGYRVSILHLAYRIDGMMAALSILALLGALADSTFLFTCKRLFPWTNFKTL